MSQYSQSVWASINLSLSQNDDDEDDDVDEDDDDDDDNDDDDNDDDDDDKTRDILEGCLGLRRGGENILERRGGNDFGRRLEQRRPYYFLCRRLPHTRQH